MSPDDEERRVGIYFGPSDNTSLSKAEVAEFIKNEMALIRSDGGPKWTEGLTTLIELGMDAWRDRPVEPGTELNQEIESINKKLSEVQDSAQRILEESNQTHDADPLQAIRLGWETQARILAVLSREEYLGVKSPNFVEINNIVDILGYDRRIIFNLADDLSNVSEQEYLLFDEYGNRVKLRYEGAFEDYCSRRLLDSEYIRSINVGP